MNNEQLLHKAIEDALELINTDNYTEYPKLLDVLSNHLKDALIQISQRSMKTKKRILIDMYSNEYELLKEVSEDSGMKTKPFIESLIYGYIDNLKVK